MDEDTFNMSVRKFLKDVGITSQRVIEDAVRETVKTGGIQAHQRVEAMMMLEIVAPPVRHVIEGEIDLG
jgi:hypothetical protein